MLVTAPWGRILRRVLGVRAAPPGTSHERSAYGTSRTHRVMTTTRRLIPVRWPAAILLVAALVARASAGPEGPVVEPRGDGVTIVRLTQAPCLFQESEERPPAYTSTRKVDCERINAQTAGQRTPRTLRLRPGRYLFRVANASVPYEVGFWLRGQGLGRVSLPSVSGGGLRPGTVRDYEITLVTGTYLYSCPLNPTLDYPLLVE